MAAIILFLSSILTSVMCQSTIPDDLSAVFSLIEESPAQSYIGNIAEGAGLANIFNSTTLQSLEYGFVPQVASEYFHLESNTGNLRTLTQIDRETICPGERTCYMNLGVGIIKPSDLFQTIAVQIEIEDTNDHAPVFTPAVYSVQFSEADPIGATRNLPAALDPDSPQFGIKEYRIAGPLFPEFELQQVQNPINGLIDLKLVLASQLDRENRDSYQIRVEAIDYGTPSQTGSLVIEVSVEDDNDHSPRFASDLYEVEVNEDFPTNSVFFTIQATDNDQGDNSRVIYGFSPRSTTMLGNLFTINQDTGDISLKESLGTENEDVYHLEVTATDMGQNPRTSMTTVMIRVQDINNNAPEITISTLTSKPYAEILENMPSPKFAAHVLVSDADSGQNAEVICNLNHPLFELERMRVNQYKIVTTAPLDRESSDRFVVSVMCSDLGSPSLSSRADITVVVLDQNDNRPTFQQSSYYVAIPENLPSNSYVMSVNATDMDIGENANVTYEIVQKNVSGLVHINPITGVIETSNILDYESNQEVRFTVRAKDSGVPPLTIDASVTIRILDLNDKAPEFQNKNYVFYVKENQPRRTFVGKVKAVDQDSSPYNIFEYSLDRHITLDQSLFDIDRSSGNIYTSGPLDHEDRSSYQLTALATDIDETSFVGSATITIHVQDVNDNAPKIHFPMDINSTFPISNQVQLGYNITKIFATDPDEGRNGNVTFALLSGNVDQLFRIDSKQGYIQTNSDLTDISYKEIHLEIRVADNGDEPQSTKVTVTIVVDSSVPFFQDDPPPMVQKNNLTIIIVVAAVSGLVIVILVIAIVVLKTTDCRQPLFWRGSHHGPDKTPKVFTDLNVKAMEANSYMKQTDPNHQLHEMRTVPGAEVPEYPHPEIQIDHQMAHHQHHQLKEADNHSVSSADMSNTDSGHGASEEGESAHNNSRHNMSPLRSQRGNPHKSSRRGNSNSAQQHHPSHQQQPQRHITHNNSYPHPPQYAPSETSYAGSQTSNLSNLPNKSMDKSQTDGYVPYTRPYTIDNGAHGYNSNSVHNAYRGQIPTVEHLQNMKNVNTKVYSPTDSGYYGNPPSNKDLGIPTVSQGVRAGPPPPPRKLKAVQV